MSQAGLFDGLEPKAAPTLNATSFLLFFERKSHKCSQGNPLERKKGGAHAP